MARRGLKICCLTSVVFLVILTIIIVTLSLTVFKPKNPLVTVQPAGLNKIQFNGTGIRLNTLVTIHNPNYGSFEYKNATNYVNYHGLTVAELPLRQNRVPARAKVNMTTSTDLSFGKLLSHPNFSQDVALGYLNFTTSATLPGKVNVANILKFRATTYINCYILFYIQSQDMDSKCTTRLKI
ncbi:hypothetical protein BT93_H2035 [Corymbia citriodora subsp. variegata]|nr:hypothetical protein BT93_H2035 [Corymbia citriodora subsp. variegata]